MKYYLTIDAGTSVIKTVIFDLTHKEVFKISIKNPLIVDDNGKSELNMNIFWKLTASCINSSIKRSKINPKNIIGAGVTGNMVGFWAIDKKYKPVRNAILWNDTRTTILFKEKNIFNKLFKLTGSITQYGCTIPILKWITLFEKKNLKKIKYILTCKDWIRFNLTNEIYNDETEVSVYPGDIKNKSLSKKVFKIFNLDSKYLKLFPKVKKPTQCGGYVTEKASTLTKLALGTPIVIGCGDVIASVIGSGGINVNQKISIIGTTCHNIIVKKNSKLPTKPGLFFSSLNNTWLETKINVAGSTNIDWVLNNFYNNPKNLNNKIEIIKKFEIQFQSIKSYESSIIFLPYFNYGGSISPFFNINSKAEIYGLQLHHTKFDILASCYEGIALSIKDCYQKNIKKNDSIYLNGGLSQSLILPQLISNALNTKIITLKNSEMGALGISYIISNLINKKKLNTIIKNNTKINKIYFPQKNINKYLTYKYKKYKKLRESLNYIW